MAKRDERQDRRDQDEGLIKTTIAVNRVTKVVKGGRNMRFAVLAVVGDGNGSVGIGLGKSAEVPEAIEKAFQAAKRDMAPIALKGNTIPHKAIGKFETAHVLLLPAEEGTGVIAGGPVRAVLEAAGVKDIRTKAHGSRNSNNCAKATLQGLRSLRTAEQVAQLRGVEVEG